MTDSSVAEMPSLERSTHFAFEHPIFKVQGCRFALTTDDLQPALFVPLGNLTAALRLPMVFKEFEIMQDSADGRLLGTIERALRYVKEIRPGNSIPRELLDGTASWTVLDVHYSIAKARLSMQILQAITGERVVENSTVALAQFVEDPNLKARVQRAMEEIAGRVGYQPAEREKVVDLVEQLARELSYIEALREQFGKIQSIIRKVQSVGKRFRGEHAIKQELVRIETLLRRPIGELGTLFEHVDAMTGEILNALRNFNAQVRFIRKTRDDLHTLFIVWDEVIVQWEEMEHREDVEIEATIRDLYRFAASRFPQQGHWR